MIRTRKRDLSELVSYIIFLMRARTHMRMRMAFDFNPLNPLTHFERGFQNEKV